MMYIGDMVGKLHLYLVWCPISSIMCSGRVYSQVCVLLEWPVQALELWEYRVCISVLCFRQTQAFMYFIFYLLIQQQLFHIFFRIKHHLRGRVFMFCFQRLRPFEQITNMKTDLLFLKFGCNNMGKKYPIHFDQISPLCGHYSVLIYSLIFF